MKDMWLYPGDGSYSNMPELKLVKADGSILAIGHPLRLSQVLAENPGITILWSACRSDVPIADWTPTDWSGDVPEG